MAAPPKIREDALNGVLASTSSDVMPMARFENGLDIPVSLYWLDQEGLQLTAGAGVAQGVSGEFLMVEAKGTIPLSNALSGNYVVLAASSGAFVCTLEVKPTIHSYVIGADILVHPNDIGRFPEPTAAMFIPVDSPRVLVACGVAPNGNVVTREQYWRRTSESFSLAPGQSHTIGFSTTSGRQETTSEQQTVATSLGLSASAGWGPISASASASLSTNSSSFQQITISNESKRFETVVLRNPSDTKSQLFLKWQLMDVITVFEKANRRHPLSSIILAQTPVMIGGPYDLG